MDIHRNVLKIVVGAFLMASLPAGAQVLGGSLGGGASGALGGTLGGARMNGAGSAAGNAGFDATDTFGAARTRAQQAGGKTRDLASNAVGTTHSRIGSVRDTSEASAQTASSASARTSHRAARAATRARTSATADGAVRSGAQSGNGLALNDTSGASAQQHVTRRTLAADGAAGSRTSASRSGIANGGYGEAGLSMKKDEPAAKAPAEAAPAK